MINIFVVDDHPLFIEGIKKLFDGKNDNIQLMGTASSCEELLLKLHPDIVDVILLDLIMPEMNGVECYRVIQNRQLNIKVIALTGELDSHKLLEAWMAGVDAIMPKYCDGKELVSAINQVVKGQRFLGSGLPDIFKVAKIVQEEGTPNLTKRELEILKMLATGLKRKEVAEKLYISQDSVNFHCKNIFKKFNRNKLSEVLCDAREYRLIP